jgi:SAM-dependent methyltransferase
MYWDSHYRDASAGPTSRLRKMAGFLPRGVVQWLLPYDDFLLWDVVYAGTFADLPADAKVLEVGSAPGSFLVRFSRRFKTMPYGVEYTKSGAEMNRRIFKEAGFDPANVVEDDFFSESFVATHRGQYDVVMSRGFIEHFDDPRAVVARHFELLKPGGFLVITIPNLRGVYGLWTRCFNPDQMPLHNLTIMKGPEFSRLFDGLPLKVIKDGYIGTFTFWMFTAPEGARVRKFIVRGLITVQYVLNIPFRLLFGRRGFETRYFSPNLVFVGRRNIP